MHVCVWRYNLKYSSLCFETMPLTCTWGMLISLGRLTREPQQSSCLHLPYHSSAEILSIYHYAWLLHECWRLNSLPHAWVADTFTDSEFTPHTPVSCGLIGWLVFTFSLRKKNEFSNQEATDRLVFCLSDMMNSCIPGNFVIPQP